MSSGTEANKGLFIRKCWGEKRKLAVQDKILADIPASMAQELADNRFLFYSRFCQLLVSSSLEYLDHGRINEATAAMTSQAYLFYNSLPAASLLVDHLSGGRQM